MATPMPGYEYMSVIVDPEAVKENEKQLNVYGFEGWELVSTYPSGHTVVFVFKRERVWDRVYNNGNKD